MRPTFGTIASNYLFKFPFGLAPDGVCIAI